jgi:hypothetical protein
MLRDYVAENHFPTWFPTGTNDKHEAPASGRISEAHSLALRARIAVAGQIVSDRALAGTSLY